MASYFKQSGAWCARIRVKGHPELSKSAFRTKQDAQAWANVEEGKLRNSGASQGLGPTKTTLATGLLSYARQVTAYQAGCKQALTKINKYLRAGGMVPLRATKVAGGREFGLDADGNLDAKLQKVTKPRFELNEEPVSAVFEAKQQSAFATRAAKNEQRDAKVQPLRVMLARKPVAQLVPADFDALINKMREAGYEDNTIRQEVAILSGFFTHAIQKWNWPMTKNPALSAEWPEQVARERILKVDETQRLVQALAKSTHTLFSVYVLFALETAMRKGEALSTSCWCDVDFERNILKLPHAKAGRREVPLSDTALELLKDLPRGKPTERIFGLTDNAAASAWRRLCDEAEIVNLHIHDLKHSAATIWARLFKGDLFLLQKVTGNRSLSSLRVYVNRSTDEAVEAMRAVNSPTPASMMRDAVNAARAGLVPLIANAEPSAVEVTTERTALIVAERVPELASEPAPKAAPVSVEKRARAMRRTVPLPRWRRSASPNGLRQQSLGATRLPDRSPPARGSAAENP